MFASRLIRATINTCIQVILPSIITYLERTLKEEHKSMMSKRPTKMLTDIMHKRVH